jgi:hypothetical protein
MIWMMVAGLHCVWKTAAFRLSAVPMLRKCVWEGRMGKDPCYEKQGPEPTRIHTAKKQQRRRARTIMAIAGSMTGLAITSRRGGIGTR